MSSNDTPGDLDHDASGHLISPFYGYLPIAWVSWLFLALFVLTTAGHLVQSIRTRTWWLLPTIVLAGVGEVIGWGGRAWSHYSPLDQNPFFMQIVSLIIAPTPLIGALFITFGRMSTRLGQQYSRLSPRLYSRIFLTCDFVSLIIQSAGGGIAASSDDRKVSDMGSNIMLAGIVFQLVSLTVFCVLVGEYLVRRIQDRPLKKSTINMSGSSDSLTTGVSIGRPIEKPMMQLAAAICVSAAFLYVRAIYRTVELSDGWNGKVIQTESLFIVFDGVMVFLTMLTLNIAHPGRLLNTGYVPGGGIPLYSKTSVAA